MEKLPDLEKKSRKPSSTFETQIAPTPRPWFLTPRDTPNETRENCIRSLCIESDHGFVLRVSNMGHARTEPQRRADAEFVCRAVNSHDALVEACEESLRWFENSGDYLIKDAKCETRHEAADFVLAAIEKARSVGRGNEEHLAAPIIP